MKNLLTNCLVLFILVCVGFGCKFLKPEEIREAIEEPKKTVITKNILKERLAVRLVSIAPPAQSEKPNPLTLQIRFLTNNNNFLLNSEGYDYFGANWQINSERFSNCVRKTAFLSKAQMKFIKKLLCPRIKN